MTNTVIKVENLTKQYRILHENKDPYKKFSDTLINFSKKCIMPWKFFNSKEVEMFKALNDVNFEIKKGEKIAIIGRNGAGKSTLLKVLSRITEPTEGSVKIKGRVASLLEVGTGFHPELTGRENIFLNGAILGMTKKEIQDKFDDIVEFSGCEKFLDTPVKRYSSGMRVRLGFAVAAHLESEILIVDEVLAVGDAEFQKKCLGKMDEISKGEGRTIIFVSHNMSAVQNLCDKGIVIDKGSVKYAGNVNNAVNEYMIQNNGLTTNDLEPEYLSEKDFEILDVKYIDLDEQEISSIKVNQEFYIDVKVRANSDITGSVLGLPVRNMYNDYVVVYVDRSIKFDDVKVGDEFTVRYKTINQLSPGSYFIDLNVKRHGKFEVWVKNIPYAVNELREGDINFKVQAGVYQGISSAEVIKK
tara:strand:- start:5856 stop:7097 length:1242 start_codon:yes stop_codon:yes gene_type:complete